MADPPLILVVDDEQSYRDALGTSGDLLVIAPDTAYFKYFGKPQPPQPQR